MQPLPVYSFDVFDTCITRMHAYPRDLFFDLGVRLAPTTKDETERFCFAQRFQRARIRAEKLANWLARRAGHEHANIEDIYRQLRWFMRLDKTIAELVQVELALEEESLYPIDETVTKIRQLRASGCRILFISDMYIPADSLGPLLERLGVMVPSDGLYVSCDVGCSKHSGKLFAHVLKAEGITGAELVHTGDNAHADIRMAQLHGIQTVHFTPAHLTQREQIIAGKRIPRKAAASWQAAFSRRCRLAMRYVAPDDKDHPLDGAIFGVIAPFLINFIIWVLEDAQKRGINRLYFVARDGEILIKIAQQLAPGTMELRYLYGSRRAWLPAVASSDCVFWRNTLVINKQKNSPCDIVERMGFTKGEAKLIQKLIGIDENIWEKNISYIKAKTFLDNLLKDPKLIEILEISAFKKNNVAKRYFIQEGMQDEKKWALVDAGWALNTQAAINKILPNQASVLGYYIGLSSDHLHESDSGKAHAFTATGSIFAKRRIVVEHCFLASSQASITGYLEQSGEVTPLFSSQESNNIQDIYVNRLHAACEKIAQMLVKNTELKEKLQSNTLEIMKEASTILAAPTNGEAHEFSKLNATPDIRQDTQFQQRIIRPLGFMDLFKIFTYTINFRMIPSNIKWFWLEGSVAVSPLMIRAIFSPINFLRRIGKM